MGEGGPKCARSSWPSLSGLISEPIVRTIALLRHVLYAQPRFQGDMEDSLGRRRDGPDSNNGNERDVEPNRAVPLRYHAGIHVVRQRCRVRLVSVPHERGGRQSSRTPRRTDRRTRCAWTAVCRRPRRGPVRRQVTVTVVSHGGEDEQERWKLRGRGKVEKTTQSED